MRRTQPITKGQNFFNNPCPIATMVTLVNNNNSLNTKFSYRSQEISGKDSVPDPSYNYLFVVKKHMFPQNIEILWKPRNNFAVAGGGINLIIYTKNFPPEIFRIF